MLPVTGDSKLSVQPWNQRLAGSSPQQQICGSVPPLPCKCLAVLARPTSVGACVPSRVLHPFVELHEGQKSWTGGVCSVSYYEKAWARRAGQVAYAVCHITKKLAPYRAIALFSSGKGFVCSVELNCNSRAPGEPVRSPCNVRSGVCSCRR